MKCYPFSQSSQAVLDLRWNRRIDPSPQQTIRFQSSKGLCQHLFTDAAYTSRQFTEALGFIQE